MLGNIAVVLAQAVGIACDVYTLVVFAGIILSWIQFQPHHPFTQFIRQATEPVYETVRRVIPTRVGMMDFAPLVVLLLLHVIRRTIQAFLLSMA